MANAKKILVAYDGSPHSKSALDWALYLGGRTGAEITVAKVFEPLVRNYTRGDYNISAEIANQYAEMKKADKQMLDDVKNFCKKCNMTVHAEVLTGHVASALLDYARQNGFDLMVAGTKGHGLLAEMLVGSVTSSLIGLAEVPLLVVKSEPNPMKSLKKMLIAYDGSPHSKKALIWALDLSHSTGVEVVAVKVFEPLELSMIYTGPDIASAEKFATKLDELTERENKLMEDVKAIGKAQGVEVATEILDGNAVNAILEYARKNNVDFIVTGTKGHGILETMLIGSVTRGLVSLSEIPVLVVK